jgi:colanic acid/amylovoran biosynthesis protein
MKVLVINTAALNTGDAAILCATLDILRQAFGPQLEVTVYDQQAEAARKYYPEIDFRSELITQIDAWRAGPHKFRTLALIAAAGLWRTPLKGLMRRCLSASLASSLDEFARADLVVSAGGTYLVPHYRFLPKLLDLLVAVALGRPFVLFTQSLGPFPNRKRWLVKAILQRARLILVRDGQSRRHLIELGVPPNRIAQCADAAFALKIDHVPPRPAEGRRRPLRVAISVRDWPHISGDTEAGMRRYMDAVAALVRRLVEGQNGEVTFISTCQGVSDYWTDDSRVADAVVSRLPQKVQDRVSIDRDFHTPAALMEQLSGFDIVVATRMHMAILALCAGVPVLPISYEFKTTELFRMLGLGHLVQEMDSISERSLCGALDQFLIVRENLSAALPRWVEQLRRSAISAERDLRQAVEAPS